MTELPFSAEISLGCVVMTIAEESVTVASEDVTVIPAASVSRQRSLIPFQVSFGATVSEAAVCPFHRLNES